MQDERALRNPASLASWRAWQREAYRRSGYLLLPALSGLVVVFVVACAVSKLTLRELAVGFGLYLAATLGLTILAALRMNAWKRAHPWTPPS